jgi:hypothetical protein
MEACFRPTCRIQNIHNPLLRGRPLLLLSEGLLVRWPARTTHPAMGAIYAGRTIEIPPELRETVLILLFGDSPFARFDAAQRLAEIKGARQQILLRIYSKGYVQQLLASAARIPAGERAALEATGKRVSVHYLTRRVYALAASMTDAFNHCD